LGDTTVTCSAKDTAGNEANKGSFKVTVKDTTAPTISGMPSDITQEATNKYGARVSYSSPTATDSVEGDASVSCDPASGSTFGLGDTTVKCIATDKANNTATGSFNVKVQDTTKPAISGLPSSELITAKATGASGARVTYPSIIATDKVDGSVDVSCDPASGSTFPMGTTGVSCSAKDKAGNEVTGKFNVKVSYDFKGFFNPVDKPDTVNKVNAGRAIPVKFTLVGGDMGLASTKTLTALHTLDPL
jgi:hypothetical protein